MSDGYRRNNKNEEATLYYLYMMADGEVSCNEEKIFDTICKELSLNNEQKKSIIARCQELVDGTTSVFSILVREKIDEYAGQGWLNIVRRDSSSLARIIWNLVYLGYADTCYSDEEKEIVKYLVDKWSVSPEVYQEFVDTADTILALTKHKEWIASTFANGSDRDKKEKNIDSEINQLLEDVYLTIEEITM